MLNIDVKTSYLSRGPLHDADLIPLLLCMSPGNDIINCVQSNITNIIVRDTTVLSDGMEIHYLWSFKVGYCSSLHNFPSLTYCQRYHSFCSSNMLMRLDLPKVWLAGVAMMLQTLMLLSYLILNQTSMPNTLSAMPQ